MFKWRMYMEVADEGLPTALGDSADEPRMVCSAAHLGDVQQLRVSSSAILLKPNDPLTPSSNPPTDYLSWTNWKESQRPHMC